MRVRVAGSNWVAYAAGHYSKIDLSGVDGGSGQKISSDDLIGAMQRAQNEGGLPGLGLAVDDCQATYEELSAKGVEFIQKPEQRPYGVEALMRDNSGNWMVLVEAREFTPEDFEGVDMG